MSTLQRGVIFLRGSKRVQFFRTKKLWSLDGGVWGHLPFWKQTGKIRCG